MARSTPDQRNSMLRKIMAEFRKRPDLKHASDEHIRQARLAFGAEVLGLNRLDSFSNLGVTALGRILDAMKPRPHRAHSSPRASRLPSASETAECVIHHLAGPEQVWAIERVFDHLDWPTSKREQYIRARFRGTTPRMLSPKQANSLLMQLMTIAASRALKRQLGDSARISRKQIGQYIPTLKKELGIGQGF